MRKKKLHKGKWKDINIGVLERNAIYQRLRSKANSILKRKYKKEYSKILKTLINKEVKKLKEKKK